MSQVSVERSSEEVVPLCVDLDRTLVAVDTLHHSLRQLFLRRPWVYGFLPFHVLRGRAAFKRRVAELIELEPERLPFRLDVLEFLRTERSTGRRLVLVTAADERFATRIAEHVGIFELVLASDGVTNLSGIAKVLSIRQRLGTAAFDYIGDGWRDLPVFQAARTAILVDPPPALLDLALRTCAAARAFGPADPSGTGER